ncbi:hypothetical protein GCM10009850_040590 [Nonomuraea monospora]|uniref:Uncharacterized protein n=1 Tax=Nonomuraea monospora TaxID=568818 RepID=A0ABN3CH36_9ACTN
MPDLLWDEVKDLFDPDLNGSLPDVVIEETTAEDWQALLNLIQAREWPHAYSVGGEPAELVSAAAMVASADGGGAPELAVTPALRVWPILSSTGKPAREVWTAPLAGGKARPVTVLMSAEHSPDHPDLAFDAEADRVILLTNPARNPP